PLLGSNTRGIRRSPATHVARRAIREISGSGDGPKYHRARAAIKATPNTYATADMAARASLHSGRKRSRPELLAGTARQGDERLPSDNMRGRHSGGAWEEIKRI